MHTIIIRPTADFKPRVYGIVEHRIDIADVDAEIRTESTEYLRALRDALNERLAIVEVKP